MYDGNDRAENRRQTHDVAALAVAAGLLRYDANWLAILGGLPGTDGQALRAAANGPVDLDHLLAIALVSVT